MLIWQDGQLDLLFIWPNSFVATGHFWTAPLLLDKYSTVLNTFRRRIFSRIHLIYNNNILTLLAELAMSCVSVVVLGGKNE